MNKKKKRLELNRESIRRMNSGDLRNVAGGDANNTVVPVPADNNNTYKMVDPLTEDFLAGGGFGGGFGGDLGGGGFGGGY